MRTDNPTIIVGDLQVVIVRTPVFEGHDLRLGGEFETSPPAGDPRQHPCPDLHLFVKGVLTAGSRRLQSAAFQLITGHGVEANC